MESRIYKIMHMNVSNYEKISMLLDIQWGYDPKDEAYWQLQKKIDYLRKS